jgi:hypothetical protein
LGKLKTPRIDLYQGGHGALAVNLFITPSLICGRCHDRGKTVMIRLHLFALAMLISFFSAAANAAQTYTAYYCDFSIRGDSVLFLIALDKQGKAYVFDTLHGTTTPKLYPASIRADGSEHYFVIYAFKAEAEDTHTLWTAKMRFPRKGGSARISFNARGYTGAPKGTGACTMANNVRLP